MPGLPSWPDDYGPAIAQGSFSPGHPRSLWLIPSDSKSSSPRARCHRVEGVVLLYGHLACPAINQAPPILPNSCSPKPMNPFTDSFPFTTYRLFSELGTSVRHTKPIAHAFPPAVQPNEFLAHRRGSTLFSLRLRLTRSRAAELKMLCNMPRGRLCRARGVLARRHADLSSSRSA